MKNSSQQGILLVVLSAFCYGLTPTFTKQIYALDISVLATVTMRFLIAFSALGIFLFIKDRKLLHLEYARVRTYLALGASYLGVIGFTLAGLKYAPVAIVILILYTYPIMILFYKIIFLKESRDGKMAALLFGSLAGMILLLGASFQNTGAAGIILAFLAAISFACYVLISGKNVKDESPFTLGFYTYAASAAIISFAYVSINGFSVHPIPASIVPFLLLGIGTTIFPSLLFLRGLRFIETTKAAALAMLEPLFAILFAFLLNGETLAPTQMLGGAILFACSFLISFRRGKESS
jgi:drug/metabolite transporter (DMT)-like permease